MVAYSFRPRFVAPILAGTKSGTIRANGLRRHAMAGEQLQLYTGMRTKHCALIIRIPCIAAPTIKLVFKGRTRVETSGVTLRKPKALDSFAFADGFNDFAEMREFWREEHDAVEFTGTWPRWMASPAWPHKMGATVAESTFKSWKVPGNDAEGVATPTQNPIPAGGQPAIHGA